MGLAKFICIYDDEENMIVSEKTTRLYEVNVLPSSFKASGKIYIDGINSDSEKYDELLFENTIEQRPCVPSKVFLEVYKKAFRSGYMAVIVLCPHRKWYGFYNEAKAAQQMFSRHKKYSSENFKIYVIDTKSFAAGAMLYGILGARLYADRSCSSEYIAGLIKSKCDKSRTLIFMLKDTEYKAYLIKGTRLSEIEISDSVDAVKFTRFAETAVKYIKRTPEKRYFVSLGIHCDFAGSILGRIESNINILPQAVVQYGIPTADVLGTKAFCIHIF